MFGFCGAFSVYRCVGGVGAGALGGGVWSTALAFAGVSTHGVGASIGGLGFAMGG